MQPAGPLYHMAPTSCRESILTRGLMPGALLDDEEYSDAENTHHGDASHVWFTDAARKPTEHYDVWILSAANLTDYRFDHDPSDYPSEDGSTGEWFKTDFNTSVCAAHLELICL